MKCVSCCQSPCGTPQHKMTFRQRYILHWIMLLDIRLLSIGPLLLPVYSLFFKNLWFKKILDILGILKCELSTAMWSLVTTLVTLAFFIDISDWMSETLKSKVNAIKPIDIQSNANWQLISSIKMSLIQLELNWFPWHLRHFLSVDVSLLSGVCHYQLYWCYTLLCCSCHW